MHRSVEYNGVVTFGGVIADDLSGSMYSQTAQITAKLDGLLEAVRLDKRRLISATVFLTDMELKGEMNRAWTEWLAPEDLPTRATLGVADLGGGVLIEVVVTAGR